MVTSNDHPQLRVTQRLRPVTNDDSRRDPQVMAQSASANAYAGRQMEDELLLPSGQRKKAVHPRETPSVLLLRTAFIRRGTGLI